MVEDESVLTRPAPPPDAVLRYGPGEDQVADLRRGSASRPLVIVLHGGFWRPQYDRAHAGPEAAALATAGWTSVSMEYSRIPGDPEATLEDVRLALTVLPGLAGPHDGRVLLVGHSAGGHLALWAAAAGPEVQGAVALAPVADLAMAEALDLGQGAVAAFCGSRAREPLDPRLLPPRSPVTLLHGDADAIVPLALSGAYVQAHPGVRLRTLPGVGHFALIDPLSSAWPVVLEELARLAP